MKGKKKNKNQNKDQAAPGAKPRFEIKDTNESYIDLLGKLAKAGANART